ncbi:MAG: hypothetical protein Ct9H300mP19_17730 [Dehalococcoidia bacterium]|nr:MAG: hypothetical protein Ct9H300mP19_17730 [Dehalococcoidia bacterium]
MAGPTDEPKGAINENYGRELLELFSMGRGNYTEDDVQAAALALRVGRLISRFHVIQTECGI